MSGLVPNYQDVVLHNFADVGLPLLACHVFAICALPLPDAAVQRVKHFARRFSVPPSGRVASSLDSVVPAGYAGSPRQAQPTSRSSTERLDARLFDIVDAVLLVAVRVNELAEEDVSHRRVLPFLKFLVATCLMSAVDGAVLSDDTWIAAPKLPPAMAEFSRFAQKYSQTPLLVALPLEHPELSHVIPGNPVRPVSDEGSNLDASSTTSSTPSDSDLSKWLAKHRMKSPTINFECGDRPAPLNDAMHRSIFATEPPTHLLAALVVDHCDRIYSSISSALYQRRAWNILTPVVGISFSDDSAMVRVLVGWLDGRATDGGHLPRVHILQAQKSTESNSKGCVARGIFCLAEPIHLLCLARLLISCKEFFDEDRRKSQVIEQTPDLCWRADQEPNVERAPSTSFVESIRQWRSGVDTQESPSASSPVTPSDSDQEESGSSPSTEVFRTYSFEQYIGLKETRGLAPPAVGSWLLDRYVGFHSLPPITAYSDPEAHDKLVSDYVRPHLPFFETYRHATRFRWPHAWKTSDHLPVVPPFLQGLEQELFDLSQDQIQSELVEQSLESELALTAEMASVLERCLPTILQICALARSLNVSSKSQRYRHCYEMLFGISTSRNGVRYLPNVDMHLSRSTFVDKMIKLTGAVARSQASWMHHRQGLSLDVEGRLFGGGDQEFQLRIAGAHSRFISDTLQWKTSMKDALRRVREAPVVGTCDHVIVVGQPAPLAGTGRHCLRNGTPSSNYPDFPVPLLPSSTSPRTHDREILSYDIFATVHHDYPLLRNARLADDLNGKFRSVIKPSFPSLSGPPAPPSTASHAPTVPDMKIPLLIVVHGVQRTQFNIADSNRLRMCLVSSVHFLASLLVFDFPIFGLLTEGTVCAVVMAWATRMDDRTEVQLMDLHCGAYDISAAAGSFNLATFLFWLEFEHAPRLSEVLNSTKCLASLRHDSKAQDFPSGWAMEDQLLDLKRQGDARSKQMKIEDDGVDD